MNVSSRVVKAHLWAASAASIGADPATSLRAYLVAQAAAATALVAAGQIKMNNANGHVTEFGGSLDSEQLIQIWTYLVDVFDTAKAELIAGGVDDSGNPLAPIAAPTDAQIQSQMEVDLRPVKGAIGNYMWLIKCLLLIALPVAFFGCVSYRDKQNAKVMQDWSWINWPTNR